jgi:hypothetical protein
LEYGCSASQEIVSQPSSASVRKGSNWPCDPKRPRGVLDDHCVARRDGAERLNTGVDDRREGISAVVRGSLEQDRIETIGVWAPDVGLQMHVVAHRNPDVALDQDRGGG